MSNSSINTPLKGNQIKIKLRETYESLEKLFSPHGYEVSTYHTPVNFEEALTRPIHRWYAYKEGFSPSFVRDFIAEYSTSKSNIVFDPYGGVGTTVLEANINGYEAYSLDVSPLGNFASKVKNKEYAENDIRQLEQTVATFQELASYNDIDDYNISPTVKRYFAKETYSAIIQTKNFIKDIANEKVHDIFLLSLLAILEKVSTHRKNGNGVKRKIHEPNPTSFPALKELMVKKLRLIVDDIQQSQRKNQNNIIEGSCLDSYKLPKKADVVITSPPYANCFDYSKVYLIELWMGDFFCTREDQQSFRERSLKSHVHYRWKRKDNESIPIVDDLITPLLEDCDLWSNSIPSMISGYFHDLKMCLKELSNNLNHGATVGFVVGNSTYSGVVISTDLLLAHIALSLGYECSDIKIYRMVVPSSQQTKLIEKDDWKYVRESMVVLKWK